MSTDDEHSAVPSPSTSFDEFQTALQSAAVAATKSSLGLPKDLSYHRSLNRKFGKRLDACSDRILAITSQLLQYVDAGNELEGAPSLGTGNGKGKHRLESEDDVVDGFSLVVDVMDQLLERADTCLDEFLGRSKPSAIPINPQAQSRTKATKVQCGRLDPSLAHASHLPKPQRLFRTPVDNKNTTIPWKPQLKTKHYAVVPLGQSLGTEDSVSSSHPYQHEILNLAPPDHLLHPPPSPVFPEPLLSSPPVTYISHASQLPSLLGALKQASEIAVDLEHHSYRSFAGFVCLMQISTRTQDWIVDCLEPEIRVELEALNEVFANPNIVKVFHGAESDIVWLQQNFNLYVVNLFDTYHATKVLDFPKHSLAALLEMFCDFTPDKRYQLADWRIRPLPDEMLLYARSDTHFLLYIYDNLRNALLAPRSPQPQAPSQAPLLEVLKRSRETALRTYVREVYDPLGGTGTGGWESLSRKWNKSAGLSGGIPASVFRAVHAWRDGVAREEDESTRYVLPNHYIFQLAERPPMDLPGLLAIFHPVPPLVRTRSLELLELVKEAVRRAAGQQPTIEPVLTIATRVERDVRVVGVGSEAAVAGLWDRLKPAHAATSSTLYGTALPVSRASQVSYSTPASSLFGSSSHTSDPSTDSRCRVIVARIHSTLVLAPSFNVLSPVPPMDSGPEHNIKDPDITPNPAGQAEVPYVPPAQRQLIPAADPNANDSIIVVGQRHKKRKRKGEAKETTDSPSTSEATQTKKQKRKEQDTAAVVLENEVIEPFDFDSVPNILDKSEPVAPAKKRREKGAKAGVQYGDFGAPPRNMSEVKSGNQSRTFR
ncbi:hypothetical protein K439DRAFT_1634914 [Ramaria rubella]|nr:hypothetical protein K439DRAFT_1634914 [Ramaria rubella]